MYRKTTWVKPREVSCSISQPLLLLPTYQFQGSRKCKLLWTPTCTVAWWLVGDSHFWVVVVSMGLLFTPIVSPIYTHTQWKVKKSCVVPNCHQEFQEHNKIFGSAVIGFQWQRRNSTQKDQTQARTPKQFSDILQLLKNCVIKLWNSHTIIIGMVWRGRKYVTHYIWFNEEQQILHMINEFYK